MLLVFFLFKFFGGDPAEILGGLIATPEQIERSASSSASNQPWYVQLWIFVKADRHLRLGQELGHQRGGRHLFARGCRRR